MYEVLFREGGLQDLGDDFVDVLSLVDVVRARVSPEETVLDLDIKSGFPLILLPDCQFVCTAHGAEGARLLREVMAILALFCVSLIQVEAEEGTLWPRVALQEFLTGVDTGKSPVVIAVRATETLDSIFNVVDVLPERGLFRCHFGISLRRWMIKCSTWNILNTKWGHSGTVAPVSICTETGSRYGPGMFHVEHRRRTAKARHCVRLLLTRRIIPATPNTSRLPRSPKMPDIEWIHRVARLGIVLDARQIEQLTQYGFLLRTWSRFTALVSSGNLADLENLHVVDSLSLFDVVRGNAAPGETVLDIGSGGGFPAIPLAIALPDRKFVLMERSAKKVSFLRKVMGSLGLAHVSLIHGSFPEDAPDDPPVVITARAVERSDAILAEIADILPENCVFLCQSGDPTEKLDQEMFHVEHWEDAWTRSGERRGTLHLVRIKAQE